MAACWDVLGGPGEAGREMSRACLWWSRQGLRASPRDRGLQNKPGCWVRTQWLLCSPWWEGAARCGGCRGERCQVAVRDTATPCPAHGRSQRWVEEREGEKTQTKPNQLFRSKSPRKCAKRGTVWKTKAMFHLTSVAGESRKCLFFIHPLRVVWLGGGKPGSVRVYVGYCAKRNYEVSQKSSLERCMALNLIKAEVTCVPRQVIPTCP